MIQAHQLTLTSASLVAALNYLGYLCGSFDAMRARHKVALRLQLGTWGAVVLTALSAFADGPWWHGVIRFAIGWASGCALVLAAAWSNEQLHQYGRPGLSAAVFAGPGAGIFISGLLAVSLHRYQVSAALAWWVYAALAAVLVALISRNLPRKAELHRPEQAPPSLVLTRNLRRLVLSYSLAGFGYILPRHFFHKWLQCVFQAVPWHSLSGRYSAVRRSSVLFWALSRARRGAVMPAWRWPCGHRRWVCWRPHCCRDSAGCLSARYW